MNLIEVDNIDGVLAIGSIPVPMTEEVAAAAKNHSSVTVGVRPEHLSLAAGGIPGEVMVVEDLGSEAFAFVEVKHQGDQHLIVVRTDGETDLARGENVSIGFTGPIHVFGPDGPRLGD